MVTRVTGLASGMDIDTLVKKLMTSASAPLDRMNQKKQLLEWKRENYRELSTKLVTFTQDKIKDSLSKASTLNTQKATVTGNNTAVTAKASSSASGTMTVDVKNLATSANVVSDTGIGLSASTSLATLFTVGSTIEVGGDSTITVEAGDTIESLVKKINNSKTAGVTAIYDATNGLSLTARATGKSAGGVDSGGNLKVSDNLKAAFNLGDGTAAKNAVVEVNGLKMEQASNTFDINGVSLTLNAESAGSVSTIAVTKDTDAIVSAVQSFVDSYNELLGLMNNKLSEERYSKYTPLTTVQKAEMEESDITAWTEKAKSGMLKNDSILQETVSNMRMAMVQGVTLADGSTVSMTDLGITTGDYTSKGKLVLDTDKLKEALDKDPDIITNFFSTNYSSSFSSNKFVETDGILAKLQKITTNTLTSLNKTAGTSLSSKELTASFIVNSSMGEQLSSLDRQISEFTSKLNRMETSYYSKFTAMETAINRYNTTASSLFSS